MNPCAKTEGKWMYSKNTDESLDECRQMQVSVDESKIFFFNFSNYAAAGHIGMRIFNSVVLSVIASPHNVPTLHISKTH